MAHMAQKPAFRQKDELAEAWFERANLALVRTAGRAGWGALSHRERLEQAILAWLPAGDATICLWITDLRYDLPAMEDTFRYGYCRDSVQAPSRLHRLACFSRDERQRLEQGASARARQVCFGLQGLLQWLPLVARGKPRRTCLIARSGHKVSPLAATREGGRPRSTQP